MTIVPVYRLSGPPTDSGLRYRFSRDAHPNPNPTPGQPSPNAGSRWTADRVAFYAFSDRTRAGRINHRLTPIYEFYRVDESGVSYRYSAGAEPADGWISREGVAFWMHPAGTDGAGAPVHIYSQPTSEGTSYALSVNPGIEGSWAHESVLAVAAGTVPVVVSVRSDIEDDGRLHWSFAPSTLNLAYATTIEFVQAPRSAWRFVDLEVPGGREDFDTPIIRDRRVRLDARYANPGRDFRYRLTIERPTGRDRVTSDGGPRDLAASEDRSSLTDRAVSDPEMVNQTPDRL